MGERRRGSLAIPTAFVIIGLLLAAGCGSNSSSSSGSGSDSTTTTAAAARTDWANSVCSALVTWKSDIKSATTDLKNGKISKSGLENAAAQVENATDALVSSLKGVGNPPTPGADEAKSDIDQLDNQLSDGVATIKSDTSNVSGIQGVRTAASSVSATISSIAKQTSSTLTQLKSIASNGEWQQAFSQAKSCQSLKGSTS